MLTSLDHVDKSSDLLVIGTPNRSAFRYADGFFRYIRDGDIPESLDEWA